MFHYLFTNDLRISNLAESLKKTGKCYVTNTVPTASQDKSANNNMKTLGFYFNFTQESNCAKEAMDGNARGVVLNFIKKFQFPNLRTQESFNDSKNDGIILAPMRMIIKVLYVMNLLFDKKDAYLTKNEIKYFIFYNSDVAKTENPDVVELIRSLLKYRKTEVFPESISTESDEQLWKQEERQLREMVKVLTWSGCVKEDSEKILISEEQLSRDNKADIYEIINYSDYWEGDTLDSYQKYMDMPSEDNEREDIQYLFELGNKEFAFECIKIMKKYELFSDENLKKLTDKELTSLNFKNSFPILIEIYVEENSEGFEEQFRDSKGRSRYYTDKVDIENKRYAITNNWYYGGEKDADTRTPFVNWIVSEIKNNEVKDLGKSLDIDLDRNRIVFGAPGTGKSFNINLDKEELLKNGGEYERVTFHPNYSYANFVGTYKPVMIKTDNTNIETDKKDILSVLNDKNITAQEKYDLLYDKFNEDGLTRLPLLLGLYTDDNFKTRKKDGSDAVGDNSVERNHGKYIRPYVNLLRDKNTSSEISYEYIPGPFMRILVKALKNARTDSPKPYLLIIEEINRANVASVFGDVFQLLDRKENGESEYSISATEDIKNFLAQPENLGGEPEDYEEIKIPNNMFIWATMNSADQGVFPMDTAFKRRWNFQYIGINDSQDKLKYEDGKDYIIPVGMKENRKYVRWNDLRTGINEIMTDNCKVNEDKLLGPFFMSKDMLENALSSDKKADAFVKAFESKVIMYLFEDVMKMSPEKIFKGHFNNHGKKIYSEICNSFESDGIGVFDLDIEVHDTKDFN